MTLTTVVAMLVSAFAPISAAARVHQAQDPDAAPFYIATFQVCHGAAAEKKFDATLADADLVQIVLNGKKGEKPPFMPGYAEKGVTEEQAKALVALMKSLKK